MAGRVHLGTSLLTEEYPQLEPGASFEEFLRDDRIGFVLLADEDFVASAAPNPWDEAGSRARAVLASPGLAETVFQDPAEGTKILKVRSRSMVPAERDRNPRLP